MTVRYTDMQSILKAKLVRSMPIPFSYGCLAKAAL